MRRKSSWMRHTGAAPPLQNTGLPLAATACGTRPARASVLEYPGLIPSDRAALARIIAGDGTEADYADSLLILARALRMCHDRATVLLIDEYDAPVMAGYSAPQGGYYQKVVSFLKGWLTGALKDGGDALAFACLTGVQRISKDSRCLQPPDLPQGMNSADGERVIIMPILIR